MAPRSDLNRRSFVKGTLAVALAAQCGAAVADTPFAVPEVDSLTLQVIVDNATFGPFLADETLPGLRVERGCGRPLRACRARR